MQSPNTEDVELLREDLEVNKVIGRGSGGTVQLVRHKGQGTFYALKVLFLSLFMIQIPCEFIQS